MRLSVARAPLALVTLGLANACSPSGGDFSVEQLHAVVEREKPTLTGCSQRPSDKKAPADDVHMQAIIHVRKDGSVAKVSVGDEGLQGMKACVEKAVLGWRFPEATADTHASLPIIFSADAKNE